MIRKYTAIAIFVLVLALQCGCTRTSAIMDSTVGITSPPGKSQETPLPGNVNEAGRIPILMYHRIGVSDSDYDRTPELFRQDLERLYQAGYRPISLKAFIAGRVDVPVGCSPVVITFDDGDRSQYETAGNGTDPTEDCAVGIMEAIAAKYPNFNPQATFFVNGGVPFGQKQMLENKMNYLIKNGYTIGNHTWGHEKLSKLTQEEISMTLGRNAAALESLTGEPVNLLALPFGIRPKEPDLMTAVISGSYEGQTYRNIGICNVGWQPELPAYMEGFDPLAVNRIRCGDDQDEVGYWIDRMEKKPDLRYISDGDPDTVTVPASKAALVNQGQLGRMRLRIME